MRLHLCWCIKFYSYNSERVRQRHRGALTQSLTYCVSAAGELDFRIPPVAATTRKAANITAAAAATAIQTTTTTLLR